jgi:hypothetical protein
MVALYVLLGAPGWSLVTGTAGEIASPIVAAKRKAVVASAHKKIGFDPKAAKA